jgi:hypothetical protein
MRRVRQRAGTVLSIWVLSGELEFGSGRSERASLVRDLEAPLRENARVRNESGASAEAVPLTVGFRASSTPGYAPAPGTRYAGIIES